MLNLAATQIAMAMLEGEDPVESLTAHFTSMVSGVDEIARVAMDPPGDAFTDEQRTAILSRSSSDQAGMQQSTAAFQFCDRLS